MNLNTVLKKATKKQRDAALELILAGALNPALGALPKRELELLVLEALVMVGYLDSEPMVYDMVQRLRITKSKARSLLYDRELRRLDTSDLDEMAIEALKKPLLQSQGYAIALEIENPYLADHIRNRVNSLGHVSDGSFSPSLIRLSASAAASLVNSYLSTGDRKKVTKALAKVGGQDKSVTGLMTKVIAGAASAVAGKAGEAAINSGAEILGSLLEANEDKIKKFTDGIIDFVKGSDAKEA